MSIIRCPQCGSQISSMAGTCPRCGVSILGQLHKCPNCGDYYLTGQAECPHCKAPIIKQECADDTVNQTNNEAEKRQKGTRPSSGKKKKSSHLKALIFVILTIVVLIGAWFLLDIRHSKQKEEADYARLENVTNPEFYQQFLIDYPESEHYADVEKRKKMLENEADEWAEVMKTKSRIGILRFMQNHPYSIRQRMCEDMIDSIDWKDAMALNTEEAVIDYLNNHPEGIYAGEASEKKNELARIRITPEDKATIRGIFDTFFNTAMSKQDSTLMETFIPEKMEMYNGIPDATVTQIMEFASKKMEQDVIGLHYIVGTDMNIRRETLSNSTLGYAIDFTLEETINRSDATMPMNHTYTVSAKMNGERKIVKMSIK